MDHQRINCFSIHMKFWKLLGVWPVDVNYHYLKYYSRIFVTFFVILYEFLSTLNLYFVPRQLDIIVEEMIFYFTELSITSKVLTFIFLHDKIQHILDTFESEMFRPDSEESAKVIKNAEAFIIRYWRIVASISVPSNMIHVFSPLIRHLFLAKPLSFPVFSYSFLSDETRERFIYPLYLYQSISTHFHMLCILNIDCFFLGLMILIIAQLRILDAKLQNVTCYRGTADSEEREASLVLALNKCIIRYDDISKFCRLVEDVFSATIFVQFGMASCIICFCLFRFTLPAPVDYYAFLAAYSALMISQIIIPCWFGTRIIDSSRLLSAAIYNCDWIPRTRQFKSSLRLFVERANKPLSITGGKMFPISLETFTSVMNSAYSFFTLLCHMQSRNS